MMTDTTLLQLTYISSICPGVSEQQIALIHQQAEKNNARLQITGLLLLTDRCFMQLLEGESTIVKTQFAKIAKDKRHQQVRLVSERVVQQRQFPDWHMGLKRMLDHNEHQDLATIINLYGQQQQFSTQHADAIGLLFRSI